MTSYKVTDLDRQTIMAAVSYGDTQTARKAIAAIVEKKPGIDWIKFLSRLAETLKDGKPRFTVHTKGNGKLPFLSFSTLPGKNFCPGAGSCLINPDTGGKGFCYSFRAHRYPASFSRQVQNSFLMQSERGRAHILKALDNARPKRGSGIIDFRLYVDGDFRNTHELTYWLDALKTRPWLRAYGYSKSWNEFLKLDRSGYAWPKNYQLNLSSGSIFEGMPGLVEKLSKLPITRGAFVAFDMGRKVKNSDHGKPEHRSALIKAYRKATGRKAFACPGLCGDCTKRGHACGQKSMKNIDIVIAVH